MPKKQMIPKLTAIIVEILDMSLGGEGKCIYCAYKRLEIYLHYDM